VNNELPSPVDTLRHPQLRATGSAAHQLPGFLKAAIDPRLQAVGKRLLRRLSLSGVFKTCFEQVFVSDDPAVIQNGLETVAVVAGAGFIPEFVRAVAQIGNVTWNDTSQPSNHFSSQAGVEWISGKLDKLLDSC
jgi:hypothetical protein